MPNEYKRLRNLFLPSTIKTIFIFESPPETNGYFYNPSGRSSEILYRSLMKTLFDKVPANKKEGLELFQESGFLLVDPIYIPVNKMTDKEADKLILANYSNFKSDLNNLIAGKKIQIILCKSNICRLLEEKMLTDGYNVINNGVNIPFPVHYHFPAFQEKVRNLLSIKL